MAPIAVLQAQLGERLIHYIDGVYADVYRTEITLSKDITEKLRAISADVVDIHLETTGWKFESSTGRLVREGAWAVATGFTGSGLWAFVQWAAGLFPAP